MGDSNRRLMCYGMLLFLFGLVTGLVEQRFTNMRMGVAAHLEGVVECEHSRRAGTGGDHTRRAVRAHDRNLLRPSTARAHRPQGHAVSAATRTECAGVQRCDRLPFASAGGATRDLWRTRTDRALARLSRDVPAALAHCAGASDVATEPRGRQTDEITSFNGDVMQQCAMKVNP